MEDVEMDKIDIIETEFGIELEEAENPFPIQPKNDNTLMILCIGIIIINIGIILVGVC